MLTRRTFSKLALSLLPAAWVASKVKGEVVAPKPEPRNRPACKKCGREGSTFNDLCGQCYMGYAPGTPPEIVLADQSSFPPGFIDKCDIDLTGFEFVKFEVVTRVSP